MKRKIYFLILFIILFGLFGSLIASALEIDVITSPETVIEDESIAGYIVRIYWFAVGAAGIVAVAVIVGGAIYYMTSSGSPDKQNDAKSYITSALWGVALLLGSYLILNTVNPQVKDLKSLESTFNLPSCSETPGGKPGIDCLPEVSSGLPMCEEGQTPCEIGQTPEGNDCVACQTPPPTCPNILLNPDAPLCGPGTIPSQNCYCQNETKNYTGPITFPDSTSKALENGTYWQYPFYPEEGNRNEARCVIYAYKEREGDKTEYVPDDRIGDLTSC
jgi:hypothetical protein